MKKFIFVLFILFFIGTSNIWADNSAYMATGISAFGGGIGLLATGIVFSDDLDTTTMILCCGLGGLISAAGLVVVILSFIDDSAYAKIENNDVLKHVSLDTRGNDLFLGAKFKY